MNNDKAALNEILGHIAQLEAGKFQGAFPPCADPSLQPIVDKLNAAAAALRAKHNPGHQAFLSNVLASLPCLVSYMDRELNYRFVNQAYERWFGISADKCLKSNMRDIVGQPGVDAVKAHLTAAFQGKPQYFESEIPYKFGGNKFISVQYIPDAGENGSVRGITVIAHDITAAKLEEGESRRIASELRTSQDWLNNIINSHPSSIFCTDLEQRYTLVNDAAIRVLGVPKEEILGKRASDFWPKELAAQIDEVNERILRSGETIVSEAAFFHDRDQAHRHLRTTKFPIRDSSGRTVGLGGIALDRTEELRAHEEAAAKSLQMKKMINGVPALVSHWDRNLRNLAANENYTARFGKTPEQMVGLHYRDVIGPIFEIARPYMESALAGKKSQFVQEMTSPDGTKFYVDVTYQPDIENGEVKGFFTIARDITELRLQELERARLASFLNVVLNSIQQGVWGLNLEGEVSFINQRAVSLLGYAREEDLLGKPMHALVHYAHADGSEHPRELCPMYDSFRNGVVHHVKEDVLWKKDGTPFPISYYSAPILQGGKIVGSVVSFEDRSEMKRWEKALEAERMKSIKNAKLASLGEMSAGIAHEVNNPLAIIVSTLAMMDKYAQDPVKLQAKIELLQKSCDRIARIIKGLRKFSRSGGTSRKERHTLSTICREVATLTDAKARRSDTAVSYVIHTDGAIFCDEVEIEQVLVNLVNNAVDAARGCSEKWVKVEISSAAREVVVRVTDSGRGIEEKVRQKLFEPFFTTKEVGEGTGLGLSIAKGILDEHKASITVLSDHPNTCFEIRFPRLEASDHAA